MEWEGFCWVLRRTFLWKRKLRECSYGSTEQWYVLSLCPSLCNCLREKHHWGLSRWWVSGIECGRHIQELGRGPENLPGRSVAHVGLSVLPPGSLTVGPWVLERDVSNALPPPPLLLRNPSPAVAESEQFMGTCSPIIWELVKIMECCVSRLGFLMPF